ncbi:hypothetical protein PF003_g38580 [Phytophthora fragariae]|nr:hypothetical protein PF003_g38580 [Phytophthora fragariae]
MSANKIVSSNNSVERRRPQRSVKLSNNRTVREGLRDGRVRRMKNVKPFYE